jgi:hypothetical protein
MDTDVTVAAQGLSAVDAAEQILAVLKANADVREIIFSQESIVNNLSEYQDKLANLAFECQFMHKNETKFRKEFLNDAILAQTKMVARNATVKWNGEVAKYQRIHKELSWDAAVEEMCEFELYSNLRAKSEFAEKVVQRLK